MPSCGKPAPRSYSSRSRSCASESAKLHWAMAKRLESYRAKRDFDKTAEPPGGGDGAGSEGRFVVQQHDARRLHWDLRLEHDGVLVSWALPKGLPEAPKENRFAAATEDHPLEYLDFQGE